MNARDFLDTNILIYAIDDAESLSGKSATARALVTGLDWMISTQVLGEFYRATTSKRRAVPLSHEEAVAWIQVWKRSPVSPVQLPHVDLALELCGRYQISYYDALILSAARIAGCSRVYSEDLNSGQDYGGLVVLNPFAGSRQ
jgi:predicted nucleic acid-binding protein